MSFPIARHGLPLAIIMVACAIVFWPGLHGGFILDDFNNVVSNSLVHIETLDRESLARASGGYAPDGAYGRPLATLSLGLNYWLSGKEAFSYKLVNLALHALNSWLVFLLTLRLAAAAHPQATSSRWAALVVALLWAVHPLQVSTVLYVVQRMEIMAASFVLLGLLSYWAGRTRQMRGERGLPWLFLSVGMMAVGMLAKETAVLLPAFALALELTVLQFRGCSPSFSRRLKITYATAISVAVLAFAAYAIPGSLSADGYANRDFTAFERVLTQFRVLPMYLGQILLPDPTGMTFYYDDFVPSRGLISPWTTLAGLMLVAMLLAIAWYGRRTAPLAALGVFWFFIGHAITSNVINLELAFEHRNYFPILGVLLVLMSAALRVSPSLTPIMRTSLVIIVLLGFGGLSLIRSATWGNELLLATDLAERNPSSARAASDLATLYAGLANSDPQSPYLQRSLAEFERAAALPSSSPLPEQGLILVSAAAGLPVSNAWWDSLDHKLRTRPIGPQETMAVTGILRQHYEGIPVDVARLGQSLGILVERQRGPAMMYAIYGDFLLRTGQDPAKAGEMFVAAVSVEPLDPDYARKILGGLIQGGREAEAQLVYKRMQQLGMAMEAN
jgi:hypothetical protein